MEGFYDQISNPMLTNLKINYLNETVDAGKLGASSLINNNIVLADSLVQNRNNNYYAGGEIVVVGKVKTSSAINTSESSEESADVDEIDEVLNAAGQNVPELKKRSRRILEAEIGGNGANGDVLLTVFEESK
jgi:hypothetical protein